jgi:hypothetical protein
MLKDAPGVPTDDVVDRGGHSGVWPGVATGVAPGVAVPNGGRTKLKRGDADDAAASCRAPGRPLIWLLLLKGCQA